MGSGFAKKKKQAREFEAQIQLMSEMMKSKAIEGQSGNGLVTVTLDGAKSLKGIKINPECVDPQDIEGLEDLILAAFQDALMKVDEDSSTGLPAGFSLPF